MTRFSKIFSLFFLFSVFLCSNIYSEIISDDYFNFGLDVPEGYSLTNYSQDGLSYIFDHSNIPVTFAIKIYHHPDNNTRSDSPVVLNEALSKLNAVFQIDSLTWNSELCSVSNFSMNLDKSYSGWAITAPTQIPDYYVTLLCYAPSDKEAGCEQFIMSTLNSFYISDAYINTPGIITSYAFPKESNKNITLNIGDKKIVTKINNVDIEASQFVVDMEYAVLTLYSKHNLWKEAWQRYYRIIYRDSYSRLNTVCKDIYENLYIPTKQTNPTDCEIIFAQDILTWVQNFNYKRAGNRRDSDFTSLPAVLCGEGNDCDSRSMLVCLILKYLGIESVMFFSPEYSHALASTEIEAPGQVFEIEGTGRYFLIGETTAKVTWGMIAQDQSDRSKWIPVIFPSTN